MAHRYRHCEPIDRVTTNRQIPSPAMASESEALVYGRECRAWSLNVLEDAAVGTTCVTCQPSPWADGSYSGPTYNYEHKYWNQHA